MTEFVKIGSEFTASPETGGTRGSAMLTALSGGGFVIGWTGSGDAHSAAQVFDADGTKSGDPIALSGQNLSMAGLKDGGFVVASDGGGIFTQVFDADGTQIVSSQANVVPDYADYHDPVTGYEYDAWENIRLGLGGDAHPFVAPSSDGGFVVYWTDEIDYTFGVGSPIKAQFYDKDGAKIGSEGIIRSAGYQELQDYHIARLSNGQYATSWQNNDVFVGISGKSAPIKVNSDPVFVGAQPTLTGLANGGFVVSWQAYHKIGGENYNPVYDEASEFDIFAQIFDAQGDKVGGAFIVNTETTHSQVTPTLVGLADGGFVVSWVSSGSGIKAQAYDPEGAEVGGEILVNSETSGSPAIAALADGGFVVSWTDAITGSIKAQIFSPDEVPVIASDGGADTAAVAIAENTVAVTRVQAADADAADTVAYAIVGGADAALFRINARTGTLSFKAAPDFDAPRDAGGDNVYDVLVSASDGRLSDTQALAITVTDVVNEVLVGSPRADTLSGAGGNDRLYGEASRDTLIGGGGNDRLDGGKGTDIMTGGAGNDTYIVDNAGDLVTEMAGEGVDHVVASVSYRLTANVESLSLTGSADLSARGNDLDNRIVGNSGANKLVGAGGNDTLVGGAGADRLIGGDGKDILTGGNGADAFIFDATPNRSTNVDRITDFGVGGEDRIQLLQAVFAGINHLGTLRPDEFHAAADARTAHDATDRIIYDSTAGLLFYDQDGMGGHAAVLVAVLGKSTHPTLLYSDIEIIA